MKKIVIEQVGGSKFFRIGEKTYYIADDDSAITKVMEYDPTKGAFITNELIKGPEVGEPIIVE